MKVNDKEYPFVKFSLLEHSDDIIFQEFKNDLHIDIVVAKEIVDSRIDFSGNVKKIYIIIDLSNVKAVSQEAKFYLQAPADDRKNIMAIAFVANNPVSALFANIFVKATKDYQSKFFTNKDNALVWILESRRNIQKDE